MVQNPLWNSKSIGAHAKISFTLSRTCWLRDGFKYRIVDSMSEWPSHCCTVRRSTPAQRHRVANVARNLCSQKLSSSSFARSATAFRQSRKSSFGLQPAVGNTKRRSCPLSPSTPSDFSPASQESESHVLCMPSASSPRSGLWLTRTVAWLRLISDQYVYMTSCSRIPVIRKNSYQRRSFVIASREELVEFFLLVNLRFFFGVARPVVLANQTTNSVRLQRTS